MGFGISDLLATNPITAPAYLGYKALYNNPAAPPAGTDNSNLYTKYNGGSANNFGLGTDVANPQDYLSTVNQAFGNLGQPGTNDPGRNQITQDFVRGLTSSFVNQYHQQTGQVPTADQVKQFIAQNATQGTAMKFVQGQLTPDQIDSMSSQYVQSNPSTQGSQAPGQALIDKLQGYADQQYNIGAQNLQNSVQNAYLPQRQSLIESQAAQNQLGQNNSQYSQNMLEGEKNRALSEGLGQLAQQRAGLGTNLGVTGTQLGQQAQQFGQQMGLANRQFQQGQDINTFNQGLANRQLGMASLLGRQQANAQQNNGFSGALGGLASGASAGGAIGGPWGAGIGAGLGGLAGYFGTKTGGF